MAKAIETVLLTTVNAPYQTYMDGDALAAALCAGEVKFGQVGSFFTEISLEDQIAFAERHGISEDVLIAAATSFADWSGHELALLA